MRFDITIVAFAVTMGVFASIPAAAECNDPRGFRGIAWGTPLSTIKDQMAPTPEEGPNLYRRPSDKMMIGDAALIKLVYEFYHGAFSSIFYVSARNTDQDMISAFKETFGNCFTKLEYEEKYLWLQGSEGQVYLSCSQITYDCSGIISSKAANQQKAADKARGAVGAKRDF